MSDRDFNRYYDEELRLLRDEGREFAKTYQAAANLFQKGGDPDVERLLEGVAFLCGRIRQQLDDGLPQISEALLSLVHPHLLQPLPRASILAFAPIPGKLTSSRVIARGTKVRANLKKSASYEFSTCHDVNIHPFT